MGRYQALLHTPMWSAAAWLAQGAHEPEAAGQAIAALVIIIAAAFMVGLALWRREQP